MEFPSLGGCFEEACARYGDKAAITFYRRGRPETVISYRDLDRDGGRLAGNLDAWGVKKGDRVILFLPKSLIFVVAHLALQKMGAVAVPLNPGFKKSEMAYFLGDTRPRLVVSGPEQAEMIESLDPGQANLRVDTERPYQDLDLFHPSSGDMTAAEVSPDDPGLIIYTSGTTGKPKGAVLTSRNLVHDARNIIRVWGISERDVLCHALPLFHVHGLCFALHTSLLAGAGVLLVDAFAPEIVLDLLSNRERDPVATLFMAVPAMYGKLMESLGDRRPDFGHMRLWTSGSAPLLPRDFERIRDVFGKEPVEREGMSETGMNFSNPLAGNRKPGSIGLPMPELEVRIVNPETYRDAAPGETGEILLKGPGITPGYWEKPGETAEAFHEGWFRTGDLGRVDEEGYYYLTDRIKHIIITGGENVSPKEIEAVINRMDGVAESSVVGIPHEKWGEMVAAAVVLRPGAEVGFEDVKQMCKRHLHDWKCPKKIVFLDELPKNTMGKVLKEDVKAAFDT
ncbi:MAG: AMP-binding protein [Deltaproteobacteria bacterium]|nr:AMP-binding protein [Deltaproteobacteria bacterium]